MNFFARRSLELESNSHMSQKNVGMVDFTLLAQNVVQKEPSGTPIKELFYTTSTHKSSGADTIDMGEPEEDMVRNYV